LRRAEGGDSSAHLRSETANRRRPERGTLRSRICGRTRWMSASAAREHLQVPLRQGKKGLKKKERNQAVRLRTRRRGAATRASLEPGRYVSPAQRSTDGRRRAALQSARIEPIETRGGLFGALGYAAAFTDRDTGRAIRGTWVCRRIHDARTKRCRSRAESTVAPTLRPPSSHPPTRLSVHPDADDGLHAGRTAGDCC
jgi:hypothetical protein